jgi:tetratricopeptide (TPR) repeat protein
MEAVDLHVLAIQGDAIWFRHILMAEAVYGELLPIKRTRLHARWAEILASAPAPGDLASLATAQLLAHHWYESNQPELAFDASLVAARAAGRALAYDAAHRHFRRALSLWDEVPRPSARAGSSRIALGLDAAETANWAGDPAAALAEFNRALEYPANLATGKLENVREAHINFLRGNALVALGRAGEAKVAWRLAADEPESKDQKQQEADHLCTIGGKI